MEPKTQGKKEEPQGCEASELSGLVSFHPVSENPPRADEEYLVLMFEDGVQDRAFTVALWQDEMWWPDAGDESTIICWADLNVFA